jgi:hypothetical protein
MQQIRHVYNSSTFAKAYLQVNSQAILAIGQVREASHFINRALFKIHQRTAFSDSWETIWLTMRALEVKADEI